MKRPCQFKDMFGKPGTGLHSYRVLDIAIVDLALTVLGALILSWILPIPFMVMLSILLLLGIFMHWLFCVDTTINKLLFGKK